MFQHNFDKNALYNTYTERDYYQKGKQCVTIGVFNKPVDRPTM